MAVESTFVRQRSEELGRMVGFGAKNRVNLRLFVPGEPHHRDYRESGELENRLVERYCSPSLIMHAALYVYG